LETEKKKKLQKKLKGAIKGKQKASEEKTGGSKNEGAIFWAVGGGGGENHQAKGNRMGNIPRKGKVRMREEA